MATHLSINDFVNQGGNITAFKTWPNPSNMSLLTGLSIGTDSTDPAWGFQFRCGNLASGNTPIITSPVTFPGVTPPTTLVQHVNNYNPILLIGSTLELFVSNGSATGNTFINMSLKNLNATGSGFFPLYYNSTIIPYTSGYSTLLTGPSEGAFKISSIYVSYSNVIQPSISANSYELFITDATLNTPPTYPHPYSLDVNTSGVSQELVLGNAIYLTSGQLLKFSATTGPLNVTISYALVS